MTVKSKIVRNDWGIKAFEIARFALTCDELLLLVKHWHTSPLDHEWIFFLYGQTDCQQIREECFAADRIHSIAELLGNDAVDLATVEAELEFSKHVDPEDWNIFCHGDDAQRRAVRKKGVHLMNEHAAKLKKAEQEINQTSGKTEPRPRQA